MTIREYISEELSAFGKLAEAEFLAFSIDSTLDLGQEVTDTETLRQAKQGVLALLERRLLAPRAQSVSESGFSISWNFDNLGRFYLWYCKQCNQKPNPDVQQVLGISMITDKSDVW